MDLVASLRCLVVLMLMSLPAAAAAANLRSASSTVGGTVSDVVVGDTHLLVSHTAAGVRRLSLIDLVSGDVVAGPAVPASAVAVDLCDDRVVFVDERGLVDDSGRVLLARAPLLPVADPTMLPATPICPTDNERLLVVRDGLVVVRVDANGAVVDDRTTRFTHQARAYAGTAGRSLRGERTYATAISVYAPRLHRLDVDKDGDLDLVVAHERALSIVLRGVEGRLATTAMHRDLAGIVGAGGSTELRVRAGPASTLVVTVSEGALPEHSDVVVVSGSAASPLSTVSSRQRIEGLALVVGSSGARVVVGRVTTNLMALSGVVLTGRVTVDLFVDGVFATALPTAADVRAGRIHGGLPVIDVDLDSDGFVDVVDLGDPGKARLLRGTGSGWAEAGDAVTIPRLDRTVADVAHHQVILVGRGGRKGTAITRLSLAP